MALIKGSFDPSNSPDTDMIDMGWVSDTISDVASTEVSPTKEKSYPSLYLNKIPDSLFANVKVGDVFKFTATGMVRRISTEVDKKGKDTSICLEIHSMSKPNT